MNHNQNYKAPGDVVTLVAPYARATSGLGALVGNIFGVSMSPVENGAEGQFERTGVHELLKTEAQAWTQGDLVFWNAATKLCDNVPTTGKCIGVALEDAANPTTEGKVLLVPGMSPMLEGQQATIAAVAEADADGTYGAPEAALINELKTKVNSLLASLKIQGIIASS